MSREPSAFKPVRTLCFLIPLKTCSCVKKTLLSSPRRLLLDFSVVLTQFVVRTFDSFGKSTAQVFRRGTATS